MRLARKVAVVCAWLALGCACGCAANAAALAREVTWSGLEQPVPAGSAWPVGLGRIGDIEFWAPNRGLLITAGEPPTIPAGVWAYNGVEWHALTVGHGSDVGEVCGATDGRIAWAGPDEFWTVSDGRPGQANEIGGGFEREVPLTDNTLCHFAGGEIVGSYAYPANQPDSYQEMHAAACLSPSDCWFAGEPLPEPQTGAFHLHWNGGALENEPYLGEGHAVEDMRAYEGSLYESVRISRSDRSTGNVVTPALHRVNPEGVLPAIEPEDGPFAEGLPLYEEGEQARALDFLHLSAAGGALWAAAGPNVAERVEAGHKPGQVTVALDSGGFWTQLIGPQHPLGAIFAGGEGEEAQVLGGEAKNAVVSAIAAEPGEGGAWLALAPPGEAGDHTRAVVVHVSAEGEVSEERTLPSAEEQQQGVGPKGTAAKLACPAANDCWLATTEGWLFHLAPTGERQLPKDPDASFDGPITYRPPDQGLPQVVPDAPPPDDSGLVEEPPDYGGTFDESKAGAEQPKTRLPLLSRLHSRLIHGSTLELRFHLAVKARVRLIAKRHRRTVAATRKRIFKAGSRKLLLRLNPRSWPTNLKLQTHALAPLPLVSSVTGPGAGVTTESTGLFVLPRVPSLTSGLR
jgi:hypothetical protein